MMAETDATVEATRRLNVKKQTLDDAYAAPANFLEIDIVNPVTTIGVGKKRYTDYEVRMRVSGLRVFGKQVPIGCTLIGVCCVVNKPFRFMANLVLITALFVQMFQRNKCSDIGRLIVNCLGIQVCSATMPL